jgi:cytochrome P450
MSALQSKSDRLQPPAVSLDPYAMDVLADPLPFYRELLDAGPVVWIEKYGVYAVGRYDEVRQVVTDHTRFTASSGVGITDARDPEFRGRPPSALVETDPPEHTETRKVANRIMSPVAIRKWRSIFEEKARVAIDFALEKREFNAVADLVEPVVFGGFPVAMGIRFDIDAIKAIGYMSFNQTGPENDLYFKGLKAGEPYMDWFMAACQRDAVTPEGIADGLFKAEEAGELKPGIASNITRSLVRGGMDSTISGMSALLRELAINPEQWKILKQNPGRARFVFDEAIRLQAPFHVVYRCTNNNVELSGYRLKNNTKIGTFGGAANRDSRKWEKPDKFDVMRDTANVHLSFGAGEHNCIGQNVARMEAECLLSEFMKRVATVELAGEPEYLLHNQLRILQKLPLRITPA